MSKTLRVRTRRLINEVVKYRRELIERSLDRRLDHNASLAIVGKGRTIDDTGTEAFRRPLHP